MPCTYLQNSLMLFTNQKLRQNQAVDSAKVGMQKEKQWLITIRLKQDKN